MIGCDVEFAYLTVNEMPRACFPANPVRNEMAEALVSIEDCVSPLSEFLKTMQTTATRLQEKLLRPDVRQKGKEQVKEKARDSVLQLLSRLQAEQAQNKPSAQPRTQEGHSEI